MCLNIALEQPEDVLAVGQHAGHEFMIIHNGSGYRCGYVKVLPGHPWHGKPYGDIEASAHGGLTFSEADKPCHAGGADDGWWVGFDCAHAWDAPDPSLPLRRPRGEYEDHPIGRGDVRTQEYVLAECRDLCEQAMEAGSG